MESYNVWSLIPSSFHLAQCFPSSPMLNPLPFQAEELRLREGRDMTWVMCPAGSRAGTWSPVFCVSIQCSIPAQVGHKGLSSHSRLSKFILSSTFEAVYGVPSSIVMMRWDLASSITVSISPFPQPFQGSLSIWQSDWLVWPTSSFLLGVAWGPLLSDH